MFGNFLCDVWNISFVWKLILVGLELVWKSCLELLVGIHVWVKKFPTPFLSICRLGKP